MAEGVIDDGQRVDVGVADRGRPPEPPPDLERAPHGWTLDRKTREWRTKKRAGRSRKSVDEHQAEDAPPAADGENGRFGDGWQAERDPEPARLSEKPRSAPREREQRTVPTSVRDDLMGALGLIGAIVLPPVMRADPHCGGALADNWERIAEATVPLLCRSTAVVEWMTSASGLRDWIGLAIALSPVGTAILQHHVTKTVRLEETEDGPQPVQEDWSAYPAA